MHDFILGPKPTVKYDSRKESQIWRIRRNLWQFLFQRFEVVDSGIAFGFFKIYRPHLMIVEGQ